MIGLHGLNLVKHIKKTISDWITILLWAHENISDISFVNEI